MSSVWDQLEADCFRIYSLPHNVVFLRDQRRTTPADAARARVAEVRSGMGPSIRRESFVGPRLFLRVVGAANNVYSGEWWFDADLLHRLDASYARLYFSSVDRKAAVRAMLRELLAISTEWNPMADVWALALPAGERLVGYVGRGTPQRLFGNLPLSAAGNRQLVGQAEQVFIPPAQNPLWISHYSGLKL